jgi:hypothetical protein
MRTAAPQRAAYQRSIVAHDSQEPLDRSLVVIAAMTLLMPSGTINERFMNTVTGKQQPDLYWQRTTQQLLCRRAHD